MKISVYAVAVEGLRIVDPILIANCYTITAAHILLNSHKDGIAFLEVENDLKVEHDIAYPLGATGISFGQFCETIAMYQDCAQKLTPDLDKNFLADRPSPLKCHHLFIRQGDGSLKCNRCGFECV